MQYRSWSWSVALALLFVSLLQPVNAAVWTIVYPSGEIENDIRQAFPIAVLNLALQKTGVRYKLAPSTKSYRQSQLFKRLEENLEINVLWSMTDNQREQQLRPIRIPITRGLIGLRALLTHKDNGFLTASVSTLDDLLVFSPVQGISWPDTKILQANGFNVLTAQNYVEATALMNDNSADFFPRSVVEVFGELNNAYSPDFRLKKGIFIAYPTAQYFFTNKRNVTLSRLIETGLQRALEDGSYHDLFQQHFGEILQRLNIENAIILNLANPLLPALTPLSDEKYWEFPPLRMGRQ